MIMITWTCTVIVITIMMINEFSDCNLWKSKIKKYKFTIAGQLKLNSKNAKLE